MRLSPFRPRRCLSRRSLAPPAPGTADGAPASLLCLAADALAASLLSQSPTTLAALPADLSQVLLERLVATGALNDAAVAKLSGLGLHFHQLPLGAYPELVQPAWLEALTSLSLEAADLSKTGVSASSQLVGLWGRGWRNGWQAGSCRPQLSTFCPQPPFW